MATPEMLARGYTEKEVALAASAWFSMQTNKEGEVSRHQYLELITNHPD